MVNGESISNLSLGDAASKYLATLTNEKREQNQASLHSFVRWYGWEKPVSGIKATEAGSFAERLSQTDNDAAKKLEIIRGFFNYAKKEGWLKDNLSLSLRVTKTKAKTNGSLKKIVRPPVPMNQTLHDSLTTELETLKKRRVEVIEDIRRAAADKDFRENVPYHAAREKKGMIDGKIMEIEETLARAIITEEKQGKGQLICVGDTIVLQTADTGQEMRYTLCNPKEKAPALGKISIVSPVGKAALGKKQGDTITVAVPAGTKQYLIVRIER